MSVVPFIGAFAALAASCEMPPEQVFEPDIRTVTLLMTGSIQGELHLCD